MAKKITERTITEPAFETWGCNVSFTRGAAQTRADSHWVVTPPSWFAQGSVVLVDIFERSAFNVYKETKLGLIVQVHRSRDDKSLRMKEIPDSEVATKRADFYAYVLVDGQIGMYSLVNFVGVSRIRPHVFT